MFLIDLAEFNIYVWDRVIIDDVPRIVNIEHVFNIAPIELYSRFEIYAVEINP